MIELYLEIDDTKVKGILEGERGRKKEKNRRTQKMILQRQVEYILLGVGILL